MSRGLGTMQRLLLMHLAELEVREHEKWAQASFEPPMVRCSLAQLLKGVCAADNAASQRIIANQRASHEWLREVMRDAALTDRECLEDDQRERRDWAKKYIQMLHTVDAADVGHGGVNVTPNAYRALPIYEPFGVHGSLRDCFLVACRELGRVPLEEDHELRCGAGVGSLCADPTEDFRVSNRTNNTFHRCRCNSMTT
jgi:hypothetical protein